MKILVTNNTLAEIGGSETYAYTLIKGLAKRNDVEVEAYSPKIGLVGNKLRSEGINIVSTVENKYDLILASHTSTASVIQKLKGFKVQTCHGIYPPLEQPYPGMNAYVSISKEVKNHLEAKGFYSDLFFNGVDCDRFNYDKKTNEELKNVLSLSQSSELNNRLDKICKEMGINFTAHNKFVNPIFDIEKLINENDLVISLGRGTYEAMSCGRNVFVLDKRPYIQGPAIGDGLVTDDNFSSFMLNNCSGRYSKKAFSDEDIKTELLKYNKEQGLRNREIALKELNIDLQIEKYLNLVR